MRGVYFYLGACSQGKIGDSYLVRTVSPTHTEVSVFVVFVFKILEGGVGFAGPGGIDVHLVDVGGGAGVLEEFAGEPGDVVAGDGHIERAFTHRLIVRIQGGDGEMEFAFSSEGEGVEVKLLEACANLVVDGLGAAGTAEAR